MDFKTYRSKLRDNFEIMTKDATHLFEVEVDKDEMWNLYLDSFPPQFNKIFRERREHDCSCCRQFIKNIGNAVVIKDNQIHTIWDFTTNDEEYQPVLTAMSNYMKSKAVSDIHVSKFNKIGTEVNYELTDGKTYEWNHLNLELPSKFVDKSIRSEGDIKGGFRDIRNVFKRSLDELTIDSVETVLELIASNSLYKGEEWKSQLSTFLTLKKQYSTLSDAEKENYAWEQSVKVGAVIGKIKNHSIGTLLTNISEGMDLDTAVKKYEQIVAPTNYKRPNAIYTKQMLENAKAKLQELGYMDSLQRRFATLDDITVNNILFADRNSAKAIKGSVFDEMEKEVAVDPKKFSKIEEISIEDFIKNVLPSTRKLEAYLENKHAPNMVSLIAPSVEDSKSMFKWDNNFSWSYSGNITDSNLKENVKSAGGRVDGDLRFSIQWNDISRDTNDLDAHCIEPCGYEIYYGNKRTPSKSKGMLDVDIISPMSNTPAVENITYADRKTMKDGTYKFFVQYFSGRTTDGFRAEIEFDGNIYSFDCRENNPSGNKVVVAEVTLKNGVFTIKEILPSALSSRDVWGLKTNQFHNVGVMSLSPNYWDEQQGVGHKHYMFMLKGCTNTEMPNSFFNEFLNNELTEHRKVMEALGSKLRVEDDEKQLSGLGFSSTKRNELVVKVTGSTTRVMKIKF
jgi:hypothetical protein